MLASARSMDQNVGGSLGLRVQGLVSLYFKIVNSNTCIQRIDLGPLIMKAMTIFEEFTILECQQISHNFSIVYIY